MATITNKKPNSKKTANPNPSGKEMGLIKLASKRNQQLVWKMEELKKSYKVACEMLYSVGGEDKVFDFYKKVGFWSEAFHLSNIDDYTNKKGHKSLAHFNNNGKYIGSVSKLGRFPIYVLAMMEVNDENRHLWKIDSRCPADLIAIKPQ